ncbi:NADPH-dependent aldehyde reductase Ahr [Nitrosomonas aestuarii]|uniref:NADPH-dependent aldehyde reductase Ahr n=1 Tax=Nitrosomonas aestuarii TaxID=52441 RepID=UPI000D2F55FC|nr:NAD(P)-dependent alcohol dehydrogenase [Nitrosomonas aestuarii]PTN13213.1 putative zinc-type alcohol dehydrogenase-like protein [Nitrosomonas aestuarii]
MSTVHAYAANKANGDLEPFEYKLGPIGPEQVDIAVESCGICHSDLSMLENAWGMTQFPFVPGHEVIGKISKIGNQVSHFSVGDRVGLGWHAGYCMTCDQCLGGYHNLCSGAEPTIVGRHGGFADTVRAHNASVAKLPDALNARIAGPLLCGGITVFNPLVQFGISPTDHVGVIGIGGLGHLALKFAQAWGCHVTAFTSERAKAQEALNLGAHETINSREPDAIKGVTNRFDLLLSTVNVKLDWNNYISLLKPRGRLHMLGAVTDPLDLNLIPMMFGQLSVSSSPVGSPATIRKMLEFAARHNVAPVTEHYPMDKVNDAMEHLRSGKAKYRIVLDR